MHGSLLAVILLLATACAREAPGAGDASFDAPADASAEPLDLLWIGAHPDDELYLSAALGTLCVDQGMRCGMLVLTRGEAGNCKRPALCTGSLVSVRASELEVSATLLHAPAETWDLGDGLATSVQGVLAAWSARSGGEAALVARMREAITRRAPGTVFAFDPRHGSSCHPDHRASGALVLASLLELGTDAPPLSLVQTVPAPDATQSSVGFRAAVPADTSVVRFDATVTSPTLGGPAWGFVEGVLAAHATQFTDAELAAVARAADADRAVFWLPRSEVVDDDPRYAGACN